MKEYEKKMEASEIKGKSGGIHKQKDTESKLLKFITTKFSNLRNYF